MKLKLKLIKVFTISPSRELLQNKSGGFNNMQRNNNINQKLEEAISEENLKEVKALLSAGADPNLEFNRKYILPQRYGNTLLHDVRSVEIVKELLLHGASVNSRNIYSETPLHTSTLYGSVAKMRELLKHGADVNATDRRGNTPLNHAVKTSTKNLEKIKELLKYGADINIRNREPRRHHSTPLDNAMDYPECAELLIKFTLIKNFDKNYRKIINLDPYNEYRYRYYSQLSSYLDDCVCEITKMKTDSIDNKISLYEFITAKEANKEVLYVNHEGVKNIRNRVFQVLTGISYPIYRDVISTKISASLERASLLNKLSELEVYTKFYVSNHEQGVQEKTVILDTYSKHEVAQYLSNNDLLDFIVAFYRYTDEPSCLKSTFTESSTQPDTRLNEASTSNNAKRARLE